MDGEQVAPNKITRNLRGIKGLEVSVGSSYLKKRVKSLSFSCSPT